MKYIFILLFVSTTLFGQITFTEGDFLATAQVGFEITLFDDTLATTVDIGAPGQNNWDFSNFAPHLSFQSTSVDLGTVPNLGEFPGTEYVFHSQNEFEGTTSESWVYLNSSAAKSELIGIYTEANNPQAGEIKSTIKYIPPEIDMVFPFTLGTTWTYAGEQTLTAEVGGFPFTTTTTITETSVVDAYGTMKLPGGITVEALRLRTDEVQEMDPGFGLPIQRSRFISYEFLAKNGFGFFVIAEDTNAANSGVIEINGASWQSSLASGVERIDPVATDFHLKQNYPNPFNPSTTIEYSVPEGSFVTLKVYNAIGKEVATLVNEFQSAGTYRSEFKAVDLPSGTYFVNLRSGNFSETKKMSLLK